MQNSLLLVDDEPDVSKSLSRLLRRDKYEIFTATSGEEALEVLQQHPIKVVISDQRMPHMSGSQLLTQVKEQYPDTIRIIISGYADFQAVSDAINQGSIYKFLAKPWNSDMLRAEIREAFNTQSLRQRNRQLMHLFDGTIEAIILIREDGIIENVNPAFSDLTQFPAQEVVGNTLTHQDEWHGELNCMKSSGEMLPVWMSFMKIKGPSDQARFAALFIDITDQKQKEARIEFQAYHDELTSLPNRRLFNDHLELALNQSKHHQQNVAVLLMGLDRYKQINDTLGHKAGDQLLVAISERLSEVVRKGETLARFGGDEFVVILNSPMSLQDCESVAQNIISALSEPFEIVGEKVHISPSIGISSLLTDGENQDLLVRHADSAMYRAKALGGNGFQFYDAASNKEIKEILRVENELHDAIKNNEFVVYYQPPRKRFAVTRGVYRCGGKNRVDLAHREKRHATILSPT